MSIGRIEYEKVRTKNTILASLSPQDLAAIGEFLAPVLLKIRLVLQEPRKQGEHVYFVETGLVSSRIVAAGSLLEMMVVGHRGIVGASRLLGEFLPLRQSVVLLGGSAFRIKIDDLRHVMNERHQIKALLSRYVEAQVAHVALAGLCGVRHNYEQRLACWICLACDAIDGRTLAVTHDYLSLALGLRRASVTKVLIKFEQQGVVAKERGILRVTDRKRLEQFSCNCRHVIASAYAPITEYVCRDMAGPSSEASQNSD